jgi:hypothetical protein
MEAELKQRVLQRHESNQSSPEPSNQSSTLLKPVPLERKNSGVNLLRRSVQSAEKKKQHTRGEKRALSNSRARANTIQEPIDAVDLKGTPADGKEMKKRMSWIGAARTSPTCTSPTWFSSTMLSGPIKGRKVQLSQPLGANYSMCF